MMCKWEGELISVDGDSIPVQLEFDGTQYSWTHFTSQGEYRMSGSWTTGRHLMFERDITFSVGCNDFPRYQDPNTDYRLEGRYTVDSTSLVIGSGIDFANGIFSDDRQSAYYVFNRVYPDNSGCLETQFPPSPHWRPEVIGQWSGGAFDKDENRIYDSNILIDENGEFGLVLSRLGQSYVVSGKWHTSPSYDPRPAIYLQVECTDFAMYPVLSYLKGGYQVSEDGELVFLLTAYPYDEDFSFYLGEDRRLQWRMNRYIQ